MFELSGFKKNAAAQIDCRDKKLEYFEDLSYGKDRFYQSPGACIATV